MHCAGHFLLALCPVSLEMTSCDGAERQVAADREGGENLALMVVKVVDQRRSLSLTGAYSGAREETAALWEALCEVGVQSRKVS
jgi:hypothetical protein